MESHESQITETLGDTSNSLVDIQIYNHGTSIRQKEETNGNFMRQKETIRLQNDTG